MAASLRNILPLLLIALPAVAASFWILQVAQVSRTAVWIQLAASVLMLLAAGALACMRIRVSEKWVAALGAAGIALCALPLLNAGVGPVRWVRAAGLSLYVAPVVMPVLLALAALSLRAASANPGASRMPQAAVLMLAAAAWVLAMQPDLAQVAALTVAALIVIFVLPLPMLQRLALAIPFLLACMWAGLQPDPLEPVPHVEQVIRLAWTYSVWAGGAVTAAALLLIAGLARLLGRHHPAWLAVPAYYAMLMVGSLLDMTPAPLLGYGAGPLLGYGLLVGFVAASQSADRADSPPQRSDSH